MYLTVSVLQYPVQTPKVCCLKSVEPTDTHKTHEVTLKKE